MDERIKEALVDLCKELGKEVAKEVKEKIIAITKELVDETVTKENLKAGIAYLLQDDKLAKITKMALGGIGFGALAFGAGFLAAMHKNKKEQELDIINNPDDVLQLFGM